MNQQSSEPDDEVRGASELLESAKEYYHQLAERYRTTPVGEAGLEEMERAWVQIKDAERNLDEVCRRHDQT